MKYGVNGSYGAHPAERPTGVEPSEMDGGSLAWHFYYTQITSQECKIPMFLVRMYSMHAKPDEQNKHSEALSTTGEPKVDDSNF